MICQNAACANAGGCLRYQEFLDVSADKVSIYTLNPLRYPKDGDTCAYYNSAEKIRVAWGIRRLLDNVPHAHAAKIRDALIARFGKNSYYKMFRGEIPLLPAEQAAVQEVFRKNGVDAAPAYERFTEETCWT